MGCGQSTPVLAVNEEEVQRDEKDMGEAPSYNSTLTLVQGQFCKKSQKIYIDWNGPNRE